VRREGCNPDDVQMSDVLCDFCGREWTLELPMVEGHQGACICGDCLTAAYVAIVQPELPAGDPQPCTMCLERRTDPAWASPARPDARICRRCARQSGTVLAKDPDSGWRKPPEPAP